MGTESSDVVGSMFWFEVTLPLAKDALAQTASAEQTVMVDETMSLLVVDDKFACCAFEALRQC